MQIAGDRLSRRSTLDLDLGLTRWYEFSFGDGSQFQHFWPSAAWPPVAGQDSPVNGGELKDGSEVSVLARSHGHVSDRVGSDQCLGRH